MPRLQVLHLPSSDEEPRFALVMDQVTDPGSGFLDPLMKAAADRVGSEGFLVFADTVEVLR